ncbi:RNA polymerase sigma factor [Microbacterium flavum]|uniref:Sigma-70 family RNA polymerase sigma factor n=1 Tax=Microbacterium flavum TaxID=415216 RepID=A0ABS5XT03_9MICO|nr:sigma-70 family RNA polymerase sigma factor [Microbacterium flavum]MBT8797660.1 sigma-70 family RNA polymerase sigma factor [Microbacterium flavum]
MTDADPSTSSADASGADTAGGGVPASIWDRAARSFSLWREGDIHAMDDLVRTMTPVLWHVVRAYGLAPMLAEDVVQATWLTLIRRAESIRDPHAVAGWLTTSARREAWRAARAQQRQRPTDAVDLEPLLAPDLPAEDRAQTTDRDRRLWSAVASLDERCRRLLRVIAFEERPDYAGIARDLGMPIGSIGPTRGRCLGKLRTALAAHGWGGDSRDL